MFVLEFIEPRCLSLWSRRLCSPSLATLLELCALYQRQLPSKCLISIRFLLARPHIHYILKLSPQKRITWC